MITFGSDPDTPSKVWEEVQDSGARQFRPRKEINVLINYFGYHKNMRMSQRFNETDRAVLARYFSLMLKKGVTHDALVHMVDLFYSSPHSHSACPALTFTKHEVQDELIEEIDMVAPNPCMEWLIQGMPDDGPFTDTPSMRKAVLLYADEIVYRYPDVVADILQLDESFERTSDLLDQLSNIVAWVLRETDDLRDSIDIHAAIDMPPELTTEKRLTQNRIRRKAQTVKRAFTSIPAKKRQAW